MRSMMDFNWSLAKEVVAGSSWTAAEVAIGCSWIWLKGLRRLHSVTPVWNGPQVWGDHRQGNNALIHSAPTPCSVRGNCLALRGCFLRFRQQGASGLFCEC